ncbi:MAG: hypothetical protein V1888_02665 [archaeon]
MRMIKKGQFSFVWIFAILAGGTILALAIWGATQAGDTLRFQSDSEAAKSISILTDPLQSGFAEGSFGKISFLQETRLKNVCLASGFGKNDISVAMRSGVGEEWNLAGGATSVYNKYIFSEEINEGEDFFVFSKAFDFPYEVSDLIFLSSKNYCFLNAPDFVEEDISGLGIDNVVLGNCSSGDEKICFGGGSDCDSIVYGSCSSGCDSVYDYGKVVKSSGEMTYVGNLIYGAIFSDEAVYNCNIKRLLFRAGTIADVFAAKTNLMDARDCNSNLKGDLITWGGMLENGKNEDLIGLILFADALDKKNNREVCGLW